MADLELFLSLGDTKERLLARLDVSRELLCGLADRYEHVPWAFNVADIEKFRLEEALLVWMQVEVYSLTT